MSWSLALMIIAAMICFVIFMGIVIFGGRKTAEYKELQKTLGKQTNDLDLNAKELWKALKKSEQEKEKILERLQNLEAIVTSEAYESIKAGEDTETIKLHLDEEAPKELKDSDKAANMAKRVR